MGACAATIASMAASGSSCTRSICRAACRPCRGRVAHGPHASTSAGLAAAHSGASIRCAWSASPTYMARIASTRSDLRQVHQQHGRRPSSSGARGDPLPVGHGRRRARVRGRIRRSRRRPRPPDASATPARSPPRSSRRHHATPRTARGDRRRSRDHAAVGGHDLGAQHTVGGEAEPATQPAKPAAQRVPRHANRARSPTAARGRRVRRP